MDWTAYLIGFSSGCCCLGILGVAIPIAFVSFKVRQEWLGQAQNPIIR